jgi:surfactin synthase thioesterase subunit
MALRLIALPSVGGNRYSLNALKQNLPEAVDFVPVELPGRGLRSDEPLLNHAAALTNDVYRQVEPCLDGPYSLYGHCMGGLLAWLLAQKIARENGRLPSNLFVYGCTGPAALQNRQTQALPRPEFIAILTELGTPVQLLENESFFQVMEPVFRADFQAFNEYRYEDALPIPLPITVIARRDDPTHLAKMQLWQKETVWPIRLHRMPGRGNHIVEIADIIASALEQRGEAPA